MDTIWISNGDRNDRAVVQGRVFLEEPKQPGQGGASIGDVVSGETENAAHAAQIYGDLAMGAGSRVVDVDGLNFASPHKILPQHVVPQDSSEGDSNPAKTGDAEVNATQTQHN